ncbi:MAG: zinc ribbon domain-containing protein [Lachnospiraceae bacterium]|nr:zinc ribbon domain-containing protein [Lachnospiraceae bacterium]
MVYCSECGDIYRRIAWNNREKHSIVWRCVTRVEHGPGKCDAPTIQESDLQNAVVKAVNEVLGGRATFLPVLKENIMVVLESENVSEVEEINHRLEELQKELLRLANTKRDYMEIADEIYNLRERRQNVLVKEAEQDGRRQRIEEMKVFLEEQEGQLLEYDERLVRKLIEKVTVYGDRFTVGFKSGLEIDVEI